MKKIIDIKKLANIISGSKKKNVLCHGVFDILHTGHLDHFYQAKKLAEILIVSVTDDEFVKKGINRPVNKIYDRIKMLSDLSIIDYIIINKDITAINTLKILKPNFYCKGPDYKNLNEDITKNILIEKQTIEKYGGKIIFTDAPIKSSSKIINDHLPIYTPQQRIFLDSLKKVNPKVNIRKIFEDFRNLKILVIGEIILDEYIFCEALGKSGKESVLTFRNLRKEEKYLGGSLAIANHLSEFVSKIDVVSYSSHSNNFFKNKNKKNIKLRLFKKKGFNTLLL
jgi:rfaE bifunctional protein nucleotidyltransferase chain/domain